MPTDPNDPNLRAALANDPEYVALVEAVAADAHGAQHALDTHLAKRAAELDRFMDEREVATMVDDAGIDLPDSDADREERMKHYPGVVGRVSTRTSEMVWCIGSSGVDLTKPPGEPPYPTEPPREPFS